MIQLLAMHFPSGSGRQLCTFLGQLVHKLQEPECNKDPVFQIMDWNLCSDY